MKNMTANELRAMFLQFFKEKGHSEIKSASVIPENDPTVLFTTAGMHPLVPYLLGQKHPMGTRLTDVQKCIRTGDIDDVGDMSHLTFFEMLGNWSLGDFFKKEMIPWSYEFLTSEKWLGIDKDKLAFTVFEGDEDAPRDEEAANLWRSCGVQDDHLFYLPKEHNWWGPAGLTGPCGPDTEMFIIVKEPCSPTCSPACKCGAYLEIWNDVFMQYNKQKDGSFIPLEQKNVDTGMGLERTICVLTGKKSVYETDLFAPVLSKISELSHKKYDESEEVQKAFRIIADHLRTATFILGDDRGVSPSNVDQGYILRRLIRRAVRFGMGIDMPDGFTLAIAQVVIDQYKDVYPELQKNAAFVLEQLLLEEERFQKTLKQGTKEFDKLLSNIEKMTASFDKMKEDLSQTLLNQQAIEKLKNAEEIAKNIGSTLRPTPEMVSMIEDLKQFGDALQTIQNFKTKVENFSKKMRVVNGRNAFKLYDTFGFPIEITTEMAKEHGLEVDEEDFKERFKQHQAKSSLGAEQRFKGGLADSSEQTACLHTATHLLQAALRKVLGDEVHQKGSNITAERLRFDFTFGRKMTKEELDEVEALVNQAIEQKIPVVKEEMTVQEAKEQGAMGLFESKYGETVSVFTVGDVSKEICGGPHAQNSGDLVSFKIKKEESSSAGVRRIKAVIGRKA